MRRLTVLAAGLALLLTAAACGDDDSSTAATTTAATTSTTTVTTTTAATTTTQAATTTTTQAATTSTDPGLIVVDADAAAKAPMMATVPLGTDVTLVIRSSTPQEFHLHGYDLEQAGTEVTFRFTADEAGQFDLESHASDALLLTLTVT
jgi:hypothetical protein